MQSIIHFLPYRARLRTSIIFSAFQTAGMAWNILAYIWCGLWITDILDPSIFASISALSVIAYVSRLAFISGFPVWCAVFLILIAWNMRAISKPRDQAD